MLLCNSIDIFKLLKKNTKIGIKLSDKRISDYSFDIMVSNKEEKDGSGYVTEWDNTYNKKGNKKYNLYLDAPIGIGLFYKKEPNAIISFNSLNKNTIMIRQLQGIKPKKIAASGKTIGRSSSRGLVVLDWQKLLVNIVEYIGYKLNCIQIGMLNSNNIPSTKPVCGKINLSLKEAITKYDDVALRLGFKRGKITIGINFYQKENYYEKFCFSFIF